MSLTKEISKIMDNNVTSFINGQKYPGNAKCKPRKLTNNTLRQTVEQSIAWATGRSLHHNKNADNFANESKYYDMINELEANDSISMKVSELNTPQQM